MYRDESQGLKIALISCVMLAIILGVTTYFGFKQAQETNIKLKAQADETRKKSTDLDERTQEVKELKQMLGVGEGDKVADLQTQFKKDQETWLSSFPEKNRYYRPGLEYMFASLKDKSAALADAKREVQDWTDKFKARDAMAADEVTKVKKVVADAVQDYENERAKLHEEVSQSAKIQADMVSQMTTVKKDAEAETVKAQQRVQEVIKQGQTWIRTAQLAKQKINSLTEPVPGRFDGEIRRVDQATRTVWINRGSADQLARLITFTVYPAETIDMTKAVKKASIEVTQILQPHLAEARILDDTPSNPILPGDKINTLTWSPGEQKHFAMTGYMDMDGSGTNEFRKVRHLLTSAGGAIDAEMDEKGNRLGRMTLETRYLVQGTAPDAKREPERYKVFRAMLDEAKTQSIEIITLNKLLELIGYEKQLKRVQFGTGGNATELVPGSQTNSGQIPSAGGDSFEKRQPPRRYMYSTY